MSSVFLSIGSNIDPAKNIPDCLKILKEKFNVLKISPVYETDPVGPAGNRKFWNLAVEIENVLERKILTEKLRRAERVLGRVRDVKNKFVPRTIDIDILPQPDYQNQGFIMIPLADIAPKAEDPETGKSFQELAGKFRRILADGKLRAIEKPGIF